MFFPIGNLNNGIAGVLSELFYSTGFDSPIDPTNNINESKFQGLARASNHLSLTTLGIGRSLSLTNNWPDEFDTQELLSGVWPHFSGVGDIVTGVGRSLALPGDWIDSKPERVIIGTFDFDSGLEGAF